MSYVLTYMLCQTLNTGQLNCDLSKVHPLYATPYPTKADCEFDRVALTAEVINGIWRAATRLGTAKELKEVNPKPICRTEVSARADGLL
ncbi:hypothetical protein AL527_14365 [Pseudomonas fulva]|nr:hypothetical protein AL527_14365 [Pseudomonas fulva]